MTGAGAQPPVADAGASAIEHADLLRPLIDSTERQVATLLETLRELRRQERRFRAGGLGEQRAASRIHQVLVDLGSADWHLLVDRRWPGTRRANLDLLLVGPPGVLLLDAKTWNEPRIEGGSLWCGQVNADEELEKGRSAADAVAAVLADVGLAPAAVQPIILLVGRKAAAVDVGGITVVGELALQRTLARLGPRLDGPAISALMTALDERCPPAASERAESTITIAPCIAAMGPHGQPGSTTSRSASSASLTTFDRRPTAEAAQQQSEADATTDEASWNENPLIDLEGVWSAAVEAATREPIEAWMTWLHPAQAQLVSRGYSGPARVRGPAGTGKTVVALHRARHLAEGPTRASWSPPTCGPCPTSTEPCSHASRQTS